MNRIRESMESVKATEDLKADTLRYLERQRRRRVWNWRRSPALALAALCLLLLLGVGGYSRYAVPTAYISMDVNPSIELGINRYGRVVTTEAYNRDGNDILQRLSLKNKPYLQAVRSLLEDEVFSSYLTGDAALVFTVVSEEPDDIRGELTALGKGEECQVLTYISDSHCMQEAHRYEMSFGKYRAYLELAEYDGSVTVEDCRGMSMSDIQDRIEGCRQHSGLYDEEHHDEEHQNERHHDEGHHDEEHHDR